MRFKLVVLTALVMILAVVISDALIYVHGRDILQHRILSDLNAIAASRVDQVVSLIEQDFERTALVASRTKLRECLFDLQFGDPEPDRVRSKMVKIVNDATQSVKAIRQVDVLGLDGIVAASTEPGRIGQNIRTPIGSSRARLVGTWGDSVEKADPCWSATLCLWSTRHPTAKI